MGGGLRRARGWFSQWMEMGVGEGVAVPLDPFKPGLARLAGQGGEAAWKGVCMPPCPLRPHSSSPRPRPRCKCSSLSPTSPSWAAASPS